MPGVSVTLWRASGGRRILSALVCAASCGVPASAHHSFSGFDLTSRITVTGHVASCAWINPHVMLAMDGAEADGALKRWDIELSSPGALLKLGWSPNDLRYHDRLSAIVHPLKSGAAGGLLVQLTLDDGRVLANSGAR